MHDSAPCTSSADVTRLLVQVQARSGRYGAGVCLCPVRRGAWLPKVGTRKCSFGASRTRDATGRTQGPITPVALHVGRPAADRVGRFCCEHQLPPSSRWRVYRIDATLCTLLSVRFGRCASNAKLLGISASKLSGGGPCIASLGLQGTINVPHSSIFELQRICSNFFFFGFCFHSPGPNEYHFPPPKARPKSLLQKFFLRACEQGEGGAPTRAISGNAGRSASCFPPDTHCHAMRTERLDRLDHAPSICLAPGVL
jgi:hypothetical protein